ncbi:DUF4209 domain-containing protein [Gramella sp. AN32]|uniref:DUF4209 domain-containing protein n=1 Tax=Christiangramia antarctica TaxID=2058158 RepID=A0ABW5X8S3_9FLAO|nr:DUF4209 domain-containing protein [Gramella sp. AN32]MCM4157272.1 hypothetical protein [Gramella sp. AN32]
MKNIPEKVEEFYDSIENLNSLNIWNIQRELKPIENLEVDWKSKIVVERKILNYNLNKGKLLNNVQTTDLKGKVQKIEITDEEQDYLKYRIEETKNTWLLSRYSHLLWQKSKHNDFAEIAILNYIKTINKIKVEEARELPILLSAVLYISKKSKLGIEECQTLSLNLLKELPNWFKASILETTLESNIFSTKQLKEIAFEILDWLELKNPTFYSQNKMILDIGVRLYNKIGLSAKKLFEYFAINEDLILEQHQDDKDFLKITTLGKKAKYLKMAGKSYEAEELLKEYNQLKQTTKLNKFNWELGEEGTELLNKYLELTSKPILDLPTEQILTFFAINEDILVDPKQNEELSKNTIKQSLQYLFSVSVFDINSNFKDLEEAEKLKREINQNYTLSHITKCFSLFLKVMVEGIWSGKINYYKIYDFLEKHSWYGLKFKRGMTENEIDTNSSWLTMLAPGIHNLIAQFELSVLMNTNKINNFILALDSLTLKFEGALRDFIRLSGGNTSTSKRGEIKEQLLEELLDNEVTKKYFTEKDIALFKYTFTNINQGKNLRNNIAHSFLQFSDYHYQSALLVFFCILRLGKYTFEEKQTSS